MCLYTKYIENPKYKPTRKNGYNPPELKDPRLKYVPAKCGRCIECRKEKQRTWMVRLMEELKADNKCYFVTLTFNDEQYEYLRRKLGIKSEPNDEENNTICTEAVNMYMDLIRWHNKGRKYVKHWFITERGEDFGRIHLHGLMWCSKSLIGLWKFGYWYTGQYVNEVTVRYVTKYMLKIPEKYPNFIGKVMCSKGIGSRYGQSKNCKLWNTYRGKNTKETYKLPNGREINLPQYYRDKIYTDEQKEKLWIQKQERGYRYICGEKVSTENTELWENLTKYYQERAKKLYHENPIEWDLAKQKKRLERMRKYRQAVNKRMKSVNK